MNFNIGIKKQFKEDREREEQFVNYCNIKKTFILRVRVGEHSSTSCVGKTTIGDRKSCYVKNGYEKQFKKNIQDIENYMITIFHGGRTNIPKHAYIDFSTQ